MFCNNVESFRDNAVSYLEGFGNNILSIKMKRQPARGVKIFIAALHS